MAQPLFEEMLELHRFDSLASHGGLDAYNYVKEKIAHEISGEKTLELPERLVTGDDLIELGLEPGERFKVILDEVMDAQLEGRINTRSEALDFLKLQFSPIVPRNQEQKSRGQDPPGSRDA